MQQSAIPQMPKWLDRAVRLTPAFVLEQVLARLLVRMMAQHPELADRLGPHARSRFLLEPTDLSLCFLVCPAGQPPIAMAPRSAPFDVRIRAPLAAFLAMLHGELDGDALFFSRDIAVEGDTEALLAFRNAIDASAIDLAADFVRLMGPFESIAARGLRPLLPVLEHITGLKLSSRDFAP